MAALLAFEAGEARIIPRLPAVIGDDLLCAADANGRTIGDIFEALPRDLYDRGEAERLLRAKQRAAAAALTNEARLLRLLRARAIDFTTYALYQGEWRSLHDALIRVPLEARAEVGALWAAAYARNADHGAPWDRHDELALMEVFGVDFGQPWHGDTPLGAWLRARVEGDSPGANAQRQLLDRVTPPLSCAGARAIMEATHARLGERAGIGRLPPDVLRALLEALLRRRRRY